MQLQILPQTFAVCQIQDTSQINWQMPLFFFSKTAEELSLVCPETDLPAAVLRQVLSGSGGVPSDLPWESRRT